MDIDQFFCHRFDFQNRLLNNRMACTCHHYCKTHPKILKNEKIEKQNLGNENPKQNLSKY